MRLYCFVFANPGLTVSAGSACLVLTSGFLSKSSLSSLPASRDVKLLERLISASVSLREEGLDWLNAPSDPLLLLRRESCGDRNLLSPFAFDPTFRF